MTIKIDTNKCIYCGGCVSVCPKDALDLKEIKIECDSKKCINCGICVIFCPMGAIKLPSNKKVNTNV